MPAIRVVASARFALELDGVYVGWLSRVEGGEPIGEVVVDSATQPGTQPKHLGAVRYRDIVVACGTGMAGAFWEALQGVLKGDKVQHTGAIVAYDLHLVARERLEFTDALITEIAFSRLDTASRDPALLRIRLTPASTRRRPADSTAASPKPKKNQKTMLQSNFRVTIDKLDATTRKVTKVDELRVTRASGATEISDLLLTVARSAMEPLAAWHDEFVIDGTGQERSGSVELLSADLAQVLLRVELAGLGIFRLDYGVDDSSAENVATVTASLYCEQLALQSMPAPT